MEEPNDVVLKRTVEKYHDTFLKFHLEEVGVEPAGIWILQDAAIMKEVEVLIWQPNCFHHSLEVSRLGLVTILLGTASIIAATLLCLGPLDHAFYLASVPLRFENV